MVKNQRLILKPIRLMNAVASGEIRNRNDDQYTEPKNSDPCHDAHEALTMAEMHEEKNDQRCFADRYDQSNNGVKRTKIDERHARR